LKKNTIKIVISKYDWILYSIILGFLLISVILGKLGVIPT